MVGNFYFQFSNFNKKEREHGQILLIVVLAMVVFLTVGLSVVSRSITNLRTSVDEENSQRAFSAAEAGVEQALKSGQGISIQTPLNATDPKNPTFIKSVTVTSQSATQLLLNNGNQILKDDGYDLWLSNYPDYSAPQDYNLTVFWGDPSQSDDNNAALEIIVLSGSKNSPTIKRLPYDPSIARQGSNNFTLTPNCTNFCTVLGKTFKYKQTLPLISSGLIARIVPLYTGAVVGIDAGSTVIPSQGKNIQSTGISGGTTRKVTLFQGYPQLPSEFFPYILFSK